MKVRHLPRHLVQGTRDPGRRRRADVVRTSSGSSGRPAARERAGEGVRPPIAQLRAGSREVGPPPYFIRDRLGDGLWTGRGRRRAAWAPVRRQLRGSLRADRRDGRLHRATRGRAARAPCHDGERGCRGLRQRNNLWSAPRQPTPFAMSWEVEMTSGPASASSETAGPTSLVLTTGWRETRTASLGAQDRAR